MHGHSKDSIHTYGMVSGMVVSGLSLGVMLGPIIGGPVIEFHGFPSLGSIMAGINISMVSLCLFSD